MKLPIKLFEYKQDVFFDDKENKYYLFIHQIVDNSDPYYYVFVGNKEQLWDFIGERVGYVGANILKRFAYYSNEHCTMENYIFFVEGI